MNRMRPLCMFFLIMTGYILLAYLIFPVEDNIWKVPDYYLAISVLTSSAFVVLYERWQKRRKPKHLPNEPLVISDELLEPAASTVITTGQASISMIQRRLGVSYTRGAELMDLLEQVGVVSPLDKKNSRKILLTREQYRRYKPSLLRFLMSGRVLLRMNSPVSMLWKGMTLNIGELICSGILALQKSRLHGEAAIKE